MRKFVHCFLVCMCLFACINVYSYVCAFAYLAEGGERNLDTNIKLERSNVMFPYGRPALICLASTWAGKYEGHRLERVQHSRAR